jgi:acetate kinase
MKPANPRILTINGGSSSIKFALFEASDSLRRILEGGIERIGLPEATLRVKGLDQADNFSRLVTAPDHTVAVGDRRECASGPRPDLRWAGIPWNRTRRKAKRGE